MPPKKGKKGKGKGKKGKKGGKKGKKDLSIKAMSENNSRLWQARLELAEKSKHEYRETARYLMVTNDTLQAQVQQTEKDTIDVVTYLKRQDQEKDKQIERVIEQMKEQKKEHRKDTAKIADDFQLKMNDLEQKLQQRNHEVEIMQSELKQVKEFRRKRAHMQKELEEIKEAMFSANREHKDTLTRMEQKFFDEKMRLQQEANQKIAELADKAHTEAISNLDETTKSVYKENVRINEALAYHIDEGEKYKKRSEELENQNKDLGGDKELNEMMIQDKVQQSKQQKELIKHLKEKVETLEKSLSHVIQEFETEKAELIEKSRIENETSRVEIDKLMRVVDLKTKEMNKVKRLAKNILDQRTQMERFFLEALEHVKVEIISNRIQYRRDAQAAYQKRMLVAHSGHSDYPKIRTFNKSDFSTNNVFQDLEAAERLADLSGKMDISDLTWEQKERVLRYLFAKLNHGAREKRLVRTAQPALQSASGSEDLSLLNVTAKQAWDNEEANPEDQTFLTQAKVDGDEPMDIKLPNILPAPPSVQIAS